MKRPSKASAKYSPKSQDSDYMNHAAFARERKEAARAEFLRGLHRPFRKRSLYIQLAMFVVVLVVWQAPVVNPIKMLVVVFHEISHVLAAYATGGVVFGIAIDPGGAGVTLGMGGNKFAIVAAGYVGSLLIGWALYSLSALWRPEEVWLCLCLLCAASLSFGLLNDFTEVFAFGAVFILFVGQIVFPEGLKKFLLRLIATTSCLYPVIDVAGEFLQGRPDGFVVQGKLAGSDVAQLASMLVLPAGLIATVWGVIGVFAVVYLVNWAADKDAEDIVKRSLLDPWHRRKSAKRFDPVYDPNDPSSVREYRIR